MAKAKQVDWVVIGGAPGETSHCTRCGESLRLGMPCRIEVFVAAAKAFVKVHATCNETGRREPIPVDPMHWALGRDTGISSMTMWSVFTGHPTPDDDYDRPYDPDDFGRCYRFLKLFPEFRANIGEVAKKYREWGPLIREWDRMEKLYECDAPTGNWRELYALMKKLLAEGDAFLH